MKTFPKKISSLQVLILTTTAMKWASPWQEDYAGY